MRTFGAFSRPGSDLESLFHGEVLSDGQTVRESLGPYWDSTEAAARSVVPGQELLHRLADLRIACPVQPSKIIAVGRNYHAHAAERGAVAPTSPMTWLMAPSSLLANEGCVKLPYPEHKVDFEAELGIVIGKWTKDVSPEDALDRVFGYTTCQDISDRNIQDAEKQFARAKGFDTFTPVGPFVYCGIDPDDLAITCYLNGELRQNGRTSEMIFGVRELVSFCSQGTTLLPGDIILTGTPAGVGPIKDGDVIETRVGPFAPLVVRVKG